MIVYKVYDDEWSDLFGKNQLCDFTTTWVCDHEDDYLPENLKLFYEPKQVREITKLVKTVVNGEYVKTVKQAKLLLAVCSFKINELDLN